MRLSREVLEEFRMLFTKEDKQITKGALLMVDQGKRGKTPAERNKLFKYEQTECISRLQDALSAVKSGDVYEINRACELVKVSLEYLNANDPRRG